MIRNFFVSAIVHLHLTSPLYVSSPSLTIFYPPIRLLHLVHTCHANNGYLRLLKTFSFLFFWQAWLWTKPIYRTWDLKKHIFALQSMLLPPVAQNCFCSANLFEILRKTVSLLFSLGPTLNSEWPQELVYYANSELYLTRNFCPTRPTSAHLHQLALNPFFL